MNTPTEPVTTTTPTAVEPADDAKADEIEAHIAHTREELGRTVEALSHKLDVRAQAQRTVDDARHRAGEIAGRVRGAAGRPVAGLPVAVLAAGTVVAAAVGVLAWRSRR